jgi:phosphatidylglycerophosphate synthase
MSVMSWQLPTAPLLGRVLIAQAAGLALTAAIALAVGQTIPTTSSYAFKAAVVFAAIACVTLGFVGAHHPFRVFGAANAVTTLRAALIAATAALVWEPAGEPTAWVAALLALLSTMLDGVDGSLARRTAMASPFGARYDMELDALLILVLAVIAWQFGKAGAWIVLAGAMRYLFVVASYLWRWLDTPLPPSLRRKAVCVLQIVGLGAVVAPPVAAPASVAVAAGTLAALMWSFGVDVLWLRRNGG